MQYRCGKKEYYIYKTIQISLFQSMTHSISPFKYFLTVINVKLNSTPSSYFLILYCFSFDGGGGSHASETSSSVAHERSSSTSSTGGGGGGGSSGTGSGNGKSTKGSCGKKL